MRRLSLTLLVSLLVFAPAALAGGSAAGDGVLELDGANATTITISGKGAIWGQLGRGKLVVNDPDDTDGFVYVSGADRQPRQVSDTTTVWIGRHVHFRITGGNYKLTFTRLRGTDTDIDLTAVGVGKAVLTGDPYAEDTGTYSIDDETWLPLPLLKTPVLFGIQPDDATGGLGFSGQRAGGGAGVSP
jgi:hypothetical protein